MHRNIFLAVVLVILIIFLFYFTYRLVKDAPPLDVADLISPIKIETNRTDNINPRVNRVRIRIFRKQKIAPEPIKDKEKTDSYFEKLQEHDNDSQNVHNPQIISSLTKKYNRLVELNNYFSLSQAKELEEAGLSRDDIKKAKFNEVNAQILAFANEYFPADPDENIHARNELCKKKVQKVLEEISKDNTISSIAQLTNADPISESWILVLVWERINHSDNQENSKAMKIALIDQLVDCFQKKSDLVDAMMNLLFPGNSQEQDNLPDKSHLVCINGRVGRVISSLTLLDKDPLLNEPEKDTKEIANLAYLKASSILRDELEKNNIKEVYTKDSGELTENEKKKLEDFEKHVKNQIENIISKEYQNSISSVELKEIIKKAQEGV